MVRRTASLGDLLESPGKHTFDAVEKSVKRGAAFFAYKPDSLKAYHSPADSLSLTASGAALLPGNSTPTRCAAGHGMGRSHQLDGDAGQQGLALLGPLPRGGGWLRN